MLVASITDPSELEKVKSLADLVEFRLDHFNLDQRPDVPCIFTLRKKEQGGVCTLPETERLDRIEQLLELQPDYCDIEADTDPAFIARIARRFPKVKLIGSYHNFKETPRDLHALLKSMQNPHFAIYKISVMAESTLDMLRLMIFALYNKVPLSVVSMGEYGKPSRVLGPIVGSALDYGGLEESINLGRYSLKTLLEVFHYRKLNRDTLIYALIGDPVEQSPGHLFHNERFRHNAVYVKMRVVGAEVPECFALMKQLPFSGLSVTMPLKEVAFLQMDELTESAKAVGAINTVVFHNKKTKGTNTDGLGALNAIEKHLPVKGRRLAILGAGGTARAIAYEAEQRGAIICIYNRTLERAKQLAIGEARLLDELGAYDILVNTIPQNNLSLPLLPDKVVMDVVYHPKETPLLAAAKKLNCVCIYGEEMFVEQALMQQKVFIEL